MRGRDIVIGDVHGCIEELDELIQLVEYRQGTDRLFFVGDMVDRGPDSGGSVRRVKELGAKAVKGNHDEKQERYAKHERVREETGKANPMKLSDEHLKSASQLRPEDIEEIRSWPLWMKIFDRLVMVHAGFEPNIPLDKQKANACMRLRYVGEDDGLFKASSPGVRPQKAKEWSQVWTGPENVVYGHIVHDLYHPRVDHPREGVTTYGIDTGCCFGGVLCGMVIHDQDHTKHEFVRVRAKRKYAKWLGGSEG